MPNCAVNGLAPLANEELVGSDELVAKLLLDERALHDLVRARRRRLVHDPHVARAPLRPDRILRVEPRGERGRIELPTLSQHEAGHDLITGLVVGHAVHGREDDTGRLPQGLLDRARREVLAVDADPIRGAPREVEVALLVLVTQVARPVPAVARGLRSRVVVVVVTLERSDALLVDDLTNAFVGVEHAAVLVEQRARLLHPVVVDDLYVIRCVPERTARHIGTPVHRDPALGGAVGVDHLDAETAGEARHDLRRPLVPERDAQRVVGIVGALGLREQVGERLARVVEVGRAVPAHVGEPPRRGEAATERDRTRRDDRRRPSHLHRVRVEQRHAHVADVVGAEIHEHRHALAGHQQPALRADDGLRRVGRARGEDERPDGVDVGLDPRVGRPGVRREGEGERRAEGGRGIVGIGEPRRGQHRRQAVGDRLEERCVPRLGDDQPAVRVLDVAQQVDVAPGVVQAHDRCADERGPAEREQVLGGVVEQDGDMARTVDREALGEERGEADRLRVVLAVGPLRITEPDRDPVAVLARVATQQGGSIRSDQRRLAGRRGGAHGRS